MDEDFKSDSICRICFKKELGKGLSLFEKYNDCVISDQINALTNVAIKEGDGLPERICPTCLLDLEIAYKFKLKCENNNEILLSAINNVPAQTETLDNDLPVKEEYLDDNDDDDFDYVEDNIRLACLQAISDTTIKPDTTQVEETLPKLSKAIDLKPECHDCGGFFTSKCKLRVHWKKVHMPENIKCSNCLLKFKTFAALKSHRKKKLKSCATAAKVRIEGEGRNRVFHCKDCDYKSLRIEAVATHMVIHSGERPFQCNICLKTYTQLGVLITHKENAHKIYKGEGTCPHCGKHIKGRTKLNIHIREIHLAPQGYPCKICNKVLKSKDTLGVHMQRHGSKLYTCEVCSKSFYTLSDLTGHRTLAHLEPKFYNCDKCSFKSRWHDSMSRHKRKHSDSNVPCVICGTFLENELQLALHSKRHTEKNYSCLDCEQSFYSRKQLYTHNIKKHKFGKLSKDQSISKLKTAGTRANQKLRRRLQKPRERGDLQNPHQQI